MGANFYRFAIANPPALWWRSGQLKSNHMISLSKSLINDFVNEGVKSGHVIFITTHLFPLVGRLVLEMVI